MMQTQDNALYLENNNKELCCNCIHLCLTVMCISLVLSGSWLQLGRLIKLESYVKTGIEFIRDISDDVSKCGLY